MERYALDISAPGEIGGRATLHHPLLDAAEQQLAFGARQARLGPRVDVVNRKVKRLEDEEGRLVHGIRRPLAESEARLAKAADGETQHVAKGDQVLGMAFHGPP